MASSPSDPGPSDHDAEILFDRDRLAGYWANDTRVILSRHEITLDFLRVDFGRSQPRPRAVLVARIACSPIALVRLTEKIERAIALYTESEISREVPGGEGTEDASDPE
jgi:hypothetical protein